MPSCQTLEARISNRPSPTEFCFDARKALCHYRRVPLGALWLDEVCILFQTEALCQFFSITKLLPMARSLIAYGTELLLISVTAHRSSRLRCRYCAYRERVR